MEVFKIDYDIFQSIHGLAGKNAVLDQFMGYFSSFGYILFILAIVIIPLFPSKRRLGLIGVISLIIALAVNRFMKYTIDRPRPFVTHDIDLLIPKKPSPSFPSDQSLIAGVFTAICWSIFAGAKAKIIVTIVALLAVVSRIFVGHHYPSDVAVGFLVGIALTTVCKKIIQTRALKRFSPADNERSIT